MGMRFTASWGWREGFCLDEWGNTRRGDKEEGGFRVKWVVFGDERRCMI